MELPPGLNSLAQTPPPQLTGEGQQEDDDDAMPMEDAAIEAAIHEIAGNYELTKPTQIDIKRMAANTAKSYKTE